MINTDALVVFLIIIVGVPLVGWINYLLGKKEAEERADVIDRIERLERIGRQ